MVLLIMERVQIINIMFNECLGIEQVIKEIRELNANSSAFIKYDEEAYEKHMKSLKSLVDDLGFKVDAMRETVECV